MTDTDTEELRAALAAGPTPGPWEADRWTDEDAGIYGWSLSSGGYSLPLSDMEADDPAICDANAAYIAACHPERIARLLDALDEARKDAERYRWLRQVAEAESSDGEFGPLLKLYGLQGAAEIAFLNKAPNLTESIDAAMKEAP